MGREVRRIGWESNCSVFRLALCLAKKYGPNTSQVLLNDLPGTLLFSAPLRGKIYLPKFASLLPAPFIYNCESRIQPHTFALSTPFATLTLPELLFISFSRCCAV
jgi:hypothetical protein